MCFYCEHICMCMSICAHVFICKCVCISVHRMVHSYVYIHEHYAHVQLYMCTYMHVCMCVYGHA